jgi:hypothetical protein
LCIAWNINGRLLPASCQLFAWLIFDRGDGSNIIIRKVGSLLTDYMALYPGRQNSPKVHFALYERHNEKNEKHFCFLSYDNR